MRYIVAIVLAIWTTSAVAQVPFGRSDVVETRFGSLQVIGGEVDNVLFFGGLAYNQLYGTRIQILAVAGLADAQVDWALIEAPQGHGQCERMHRLLAITPNGVSFSSPFGPCNGQPVDMQILPGQVQVTLTGDGGISGTYTFNGEQVHEGPFATAPAPLDVMPTRFAQSPNVTTRFGRIWVEQRGQWAQRLVRDGTPLPLDEQEMFWARGVYQGDANSDYVIVSSNHRGNMCGGYNEWFLLRVTADDTVISQPIGACTALTNVRVEEGVLVLDSSHPDLTISHETVRWDGVSMTSQVVAAPVANPAGAGEDVTRWIGAWTWQVFNDPSERARFGTVMSADDLGELAAAMSLGASAIEERDGWILATGCQQHACSLNMGAFGIRIADGAAAAALLSGSGDTVTRRAAFGLADDPVFASALEVFRQ